MKQFKNFRQKDPRRERLGQEYFGPRFQSSGNHLGCAYRAEEEDRDGRTLANAARHFYSTHLRHPDVQDDQIGLDLQKLTESRWTIFGCKHLKAIDLLQQTFEQGQEVRAVVHNQQSRRAHF